jgi:hypothetical protein
MKSIESLTLKAKNKIKRTWAGPGKFGIFILFCILTITVFESLGLSNKDKNIEIRSIKKVVYPVQLHEKNVVSKSDNELSSNNNNIEERIKLSSEYENEVKQRARVSILMHAALNMNQAEDY